MRETMNPGHAYYLDSACNLPTRALANSFWIFPEDMPPAMNEATSSEGSVVNLPIKFIELTANPRTCFKVIIRADERLK